MSYSFLDKTGLASVWAKIKAALATKANSADLADIAISGSYEDLNDIPEILTTNDDVVTEDKVPYLFRKSPDSDRAVEEIVGGTVGWNQLCKNGDFSDGSSYWAKSDSQDSYSIDNGVYTLTLSSTPVNYYGHRIQSNPGTSISGHKVLCSCYMRSSKQCGFVIGLTSSTSASGLSKANNANQWTQISNIMSVNANGTYSLQCSPGYSYSELSAGDTIDVKEVILTDLTTMFGSTIADYIYSLEQSTAGAGVAKLKEWGFFTEDYYDYCEPTLRSVEGLVSKKTVGFNQWDEEWRNGYYNPITGVFVSSNRYICSKNAIPVLPSTTYYIKTSANEFEICELDANKNFLRQLRSGIIDATFDTDADTHYIQIGSHIADKIISYDPLTKPICINLSDPTRNGQYEPYESHTYSLDSSIELRGVPKLDSNNNLYFDGDIYPADGQGKRRYILADMGDLNWTKQTSYGFYSTSLSSLIKNPTSNTVKANIFCLSKITVTWNELATGGTETNYIAVSAGYLGVADSRDISASDFKTAMSGVMLLYELATPTTFAAQPYHNPQIVGDTEEFVTTGLVPVGHSTKYHTSYYTTNDYIKEKGYLTEKDILGKVNTSDLATVATSGSYNDLEDKPTIPTNEIFIGSTTPSGYTLYIDPEGSLSNGEGVSF